jgi:hypothetical protein
MIKSGVLAVLVLQLARRGAVTWPGWLGSWLARGWPSSSKRMAWWPTASGELQACRHIFLCVRAFCGFCFSAFSAGFSFFLCFSLWRSTYSKNVCYIRYIIIIKYLFWGSHGAGAR